MVDVWILFELVGLETARVSTKNNCSKGLCNVEQGFVVLLAASRVWSNPVGSHDTT